jgi:sucrose phosphorylase
MKAKEKILNYLTYLYGNNAADAFEQIEAAVKSFRECFDKKIEETPQKFNQSDVILITYGDMVTREGENPLQTLHEFLLTRIHGLINTVHLLPFYPYSSDDGFSVIDFLEVNPKLGNWEDIERLGITFDLVFDGVVNHISSRSNWYQEFIKENPDYLDYFITIEPDVDLSQVFRPRSLPLKTPVETASGLKFVWTTFSDDQIDLNYQNPEVLVEVIRALLFYVSKGAKYIRLDAIAFLWKEPGTSSIHLPQTHTIIKLIKKVFDIACPWVKLITETNVPHKDNISYFGDGRDEASMVYNFSLPPLVLHAFHTENSEVLSKWASTLEVPSEETAFFNFLASHDGIGVTPARGLLSDQEINQMANRVIKLGGKVSFKQNPDGSKSPYELNVNFLDALGDPDLEDELDELVVKRFLSSQAIMLVLKGVPGIYFHSLFGSRNWLEGVELSGKPRRINREKLEHQMIEECLLDPNSLRSKVYSGYRTLIENRISHSAFDPLGDQKILDLHNSLFSVLRISPDNRQRVLCLQNLSSSRIQLNIDPVVIFASSNSAVENILTGEDIKSNGTLELSVNPYEIAWLCVNSNETS